MASFGDLLRTLRANAGMTQEDLAEQAGLGVRTIDDLEHGIAEPARRDPLRNDTIRLLADALGLSGEERARFERAVAEALSPARQGKGVGHVFVSYVREDTPAVDRLQARLEAADVRVWRDVDDVWPGQDWRAEIRRAINENSLVFLACFSSSSQARTLTYQRAELGLAIEQFRLRNPDVPWLIPVRLDECEIPDLDIGAGRTLAWIQRVDLFGARAEDNAGRLVMTVQQILRNRSRPVREWRAPGPRHHWTLDRRRFAALSTHAAAEELALAADRDAVELLAGSAADRSAEVLGVLVQADPARVTSLLGWMNQVTARDLIGRMVTADASLGWLRPLPEAARAMAQCALVMRSDVGAPSGWLVSAGASLQGTEGFRQKFERGDVHWSERGGAQAMAGPIADYHRELGGSGARLGFPLTPAGTTTASSGTAGLWQRFESSSDYSHATCEHLGLRCGSTVYWSRHGAHATWGAIGEFFEKHHGTAGWLGFPISDETEVIGCARDGGHRTTGWCQRFEGGTVYHSEKTKTIAVPRLIADHHEQSHEGVASALGFPVSPKLDAASSPPPFETHGLFQRFEARRDYSDDIVSCWSEDEGPGGATIYSSPAHGTYCVGWANGTLYERIGGTGSWLGFPTSDGTARRMAGRVCRVQQFEGGVIFYSDDHGSVAVPKATIEYLDQHAGLDEQLGLPLTRSQKSAADEPVQFFENGVITLRDGHVEAWLPASAIREPSTDASPAQARDDGGDDSPVRMHQVHDRASDHQELRDKAGPLLDPKESAKLTNPVQTVAVFTDDDNGFFQWLDQHQDGYFINTERTPTRKYLVLHRPCCPHFTRNPDKHWTKDYTKICAPTPGDLEHWAASTVDGEATLCRTCFGGLAARPATSQAPSPAGTFPANAPNWKLILEAARALKAAGQTPFTRISIYEWIWRRYPREQHDRPSLDPTFQGMIKNATGGPPSAAGTPLVKVDRGQYELADSNVNVG
jgi:uncharacterized protein with LGFP repeats/transcriptional regulator with XRE-family HTH domain